MDSCAGKSAPPQIHCHEDGYGCRPAVAYRTRSPSLQLCGHALSHLYSTPPTYRGTRRGSRSIARTSSYNLANFHLLLGLIKGVNPKLLEQLTHFNCSEPQCKI
jgi:hypothetical protein